MNQRLAQVFIVALLVGLAPAVGIVHALGGAPAVPWAVIAGGGAPSSGTGVTLNDTLGQPVVGPVGGGNVSLAAGYWVNCSAAAAVAPAVTAARSSTDVVLTWSANSADAQYQVWISTNPYFDPDQPGGVTPVITAGTTYTDTGAAANQPNHFYVVRGMNACGAASTNSGRTGKVTFGLTPGMP